MPDSYAAWRNRLATANDPAFWPIEALDALLLAGDAQFWCDGTAALVTRIMPYPGGAVAVEAIAAAGDKDALTGPIAADVETWGREVGATHLLVAGRPGWTRALGWKHHQSILIKGLAYGQ